MAWPTAVKRPTEHLMDLLTGKVPYDDAAPCARSMADYEYYKAAKEVLEGKNSIEKRKRLDAVPDYAKPYVEKWIKRLL